MRYSELKTSIGDYITQNVGIYTIKRTEVDYFIIRKEYP